MTKGSYPCDKELSREKLRTLFEYIDGELYWRARGSGRQIGRPAGSVCSLGYRHIGIAGKLYYAHRLIWIYHGKKFTPVIDHINGNKADNRIENLRTATVSQNCMNRKQRSDNTSGYKGVCWDKDKQKWRVRIGFNGKDYHGGRFSSIQEAAAAAANLRQQLHGNYARC